MDKPNHYTINPPSDRKIQRLLRGRKVVNDRIRIAMKISQHDFEVVMKTLRDLCGIYFVPGILPTEQTQAAWDDVLAGARLRLPMLTRYPDDWAARIYVSRYWQGTCEKRRYREAKSRDHGSKSFCPRDKSKSDIEAVESSRALRVRQNLTKRPHPNDLLPTSSRQIKRGKFAYYDNEPKICDPETLSDDEAYDGLPISKIRAGKEKDARAQNLFQEFISGPYKIESNDVEASSDEDEDLYRPIAPPSGHRTKPVPRSKPINNPPRSLSDRLHKPPSTHPSSQNGLYRLLKSLAIDLSSFLPQFVKLGIDDEKTLTIVADWEPEVRRRWFLDQMGNMGINAVEMQVVISGFDDFQKRTKSA
ncbi:hypothetical protein BJ138DRAFT_1178987 [Hygrophoropsis aurantiaca]|uniref:Uncharacterized protein n=1 Tax=Hygrophoropsis aurantiaca TaxID=72124 RepID=A0ACB8AFB6_9AGAM|nr:hypothetical protein BJ138DRAFT_1178987 [Hygrophoropsis aurantiaca]